MTTWGADANAGGSASLLCLTQSTTLRTSVTAPLDTSLMHQGASLMLITSASLMLITLTSTSLMLITFTTRWQHKSKPACTIRSFVTLECTWPGDEVALEVRPSFQGVQICHEILPTEAHWGQILEIILIVHHLINIKALCHQCLLRSSVWFRLEPRTQIQGYKTTVKSNKHTSEKYTRYTVVSSWSL